MTCRLSEWGLTLELVEVHNGDVVGAPPDLLDLVIEVEVGELSDVRFGEIIHWLGKAEGDEGCQSQEEGVRLHIDLNIML